MIEQNNKQNIGALKYWITGLKVSLEHHINAENYEYCLTLKRRIEELEKDINKLSGITSSTNKR